MDIGQIRVSNGERKNFGRKEQGRIRPETGRIALRNFGNPALLSGQYPARFRPDSDVSGTVHVGSDFHFFYFVILTCFSALVCSGTF